MDVLIRGQWLLPIEKDGIAVNDDLLFCLNIG